MGRPTEEELEMALRAAALMREQDSDPYFLAKSLLNHHYRLEQMNHLLDAVKAYLHAGMAEHEHARLLKALEVVRQSENPDGDTRFGLD